MDATVGAVDTFETALVIGATVLAEAGARMGEMLAGMGAETVGEMGDDVSTGPGAKRAEMLEGGTYPRG